MEEANSPRTIIVMGAQGSGKGTQLSLLKNYFSNNIPGAVFQFSTGDGFRALLKDTTYTAHQASDYYHAGKLQPLFLTVTMWGKAFMEMLDKGQHIFIDGYPRTEIEAQVLDTAFDFYTREKVDVLFFDVPEAQVIERMKARGRSDDTDEAIAERLAYYNKYTVPVFDYYKKNPRYMIHTIDAHRSIEDIHADVIKVLHLQ